MGDGILLIGRSIGTGPALRIAAENAVYGVVLVSPFTSVQELCRNHVGPLAYFVQERFPNKERMSRVRSPLLLVHGKRDIIVPFSHGQELFDLCRTRKRLVAPEDMEHNTNLHSDVSFFVLPMLQFFPLPDYCFEEIRLPPSVFDKRLAVRSRRRPVSARIERRPSWNVLGARGELARVSEPPPPPLHWPTMNQASPRRDSKTEEQIAEEVASKAVQRYLAKAGFADVEAVRAVPRYCAPLTSKRFGDAALENAVCELPVPPAEDGPFMKVPVTNSIGPALLMDLPELVGFSM